MPKKDKIVIFCLDQPISRMAEFATHVKVALCQVLVGADKETNIKKVEEAISATGDAQLVVSFFYYRSHRHSFLKDIPGIA